MIYKIIVQQALMSSILLATVFNAHSQEMCLGARSMSMSGVCAGLEDLWAVANNPAGLGRYDKLSLGTHLEQRYLLKELGYYGLAVSVPAGSGCFGFSTLFSGYQKYSHQKVNLSYGRVFGEHFLCGISLIYLFQKAGDGAAMHELTFQAGIIAGLSEKTTIAFSTFNPFQFFYSNKGYATLPSLFRLALSYQYTSSLVMHAEVEKDLDYAAVLKIGMEYTIKDVFIIRGGFRMFPASWSFGAAFHHKKLLFEIASVYHHYLGFTPQLSFQYNLR